MNMDVRTEHIQSNEGKCGLQFNSSSDETSVAHPIFGHDSGDSECNSASVKEKHVQDSMFVYKASPDDGVS